MPEEPLQVYTIFHLNLAYSSIEEERRREVIEQCYWPLIRLVKKVNVPLGIEVSGYTLETVAELDPEWIRIFRGLVTIGSCELIGSGYAQLIGPLVPSQVNRANLQCGQDVYERLLGIRPRIALVNEQAYSAGLIELYRGAGYEAIVMDWDNPALTHPEWEKELRYFPQYACGPWQTEIPLIWNHSFALQKFQRFVHGELEWDGYLNYLLAQWNGQSRAFPLYGNDVEIFNFRPSRFETEPANQGQLEWQRIEQVFQYLGGDGRFQLVLPSKVLNLLNHDQAGKRLSLESLEYPIPVKKQAKYNVLRWGLTGRDDATINSLCWDIYERLKSLPSVMSDDWRELCYLWSSDFRTHITEQRWEQYRERLAGFHNSVKAKSVEGSWVDRCQLSIRSPSSAHDLKTWRKDRYFMVEGDHLKLILDLRRGMAIESLWIGEKSGPPLLGTLPHGFYDDIRWGADFYSGHLVFESPGRHKVTDLNPVESFSQMIPAPSEIQIGGTIKTKYGLIRKTIVVNGEGGIGIRYHLDWSNVPRGVLRLGHLTVNPLSFDLGNLVLETHNGGFCVESFSLRGKGVDHGQPVSFLVSANNGFGFTEGRLSLGDHARKIWVYGNQAKGYVLPLLKFAPVCSSYFCRLSFSAQECDDTSSYEASQVLQKEYEYCLTVQEKTSSRFGAPLFDRAGEIQLV